MSFGAMSLDVAPAVSMSHACLSGLLDALYQRGLIELLTFTNIIGPKVT